MNIAQYQTIADDWERRATIRTRPRRLLENDDKLIYPLCRQPLVLSAAFLEHCPQCRDFVLVQSFYKFLSDRREERAARNDSWRCCARSCRRFQFRISPRR